MSMYILRMNLRLLKRGNEQGADALFILDMHVLINLSLFFVRISLHKKADISFWKNKYKLCLHIKRAKDLFSNVYLLKVYVYYKKHSNSC